MIVVVNPSNSAGHSFKGLHAYCGHDQGRAQTSERVEWIETRNLATDDPSQAWKIMAATARAQNDLKRAAGIRPGKAPKDGPVEHVVLSWDKDEPADPETMKAAVDEFLSQYGVDPARMRSGKKPKERQFADDHQVVAYAHRDTDNVHLHLMINRIHPQTGRVLPTNNNFDKAQKWALEFSKRHGTDHKTPAREENRELRENGEYVKGDRRKTRNAYEQEQALREAAANDNDLSKVIDQQRAKDAALALRGRNMAAMHGRARDQIVAAHKERKAALARDLQRRSNAVRAEVREAYRPKWRKLRRDQESEKTTFAALEKSFFGRTANMAKLSAEMIREGSTGIIGRTFKIMSDASARKAYFDKAQERARNALQREQTLKVSAAISELKAAQQPRYADLRAVFLRDREDTLKSQAAETAALKKAWADRSADKQAAFETAIDHAKPRQPQDPGTGFTRVAFKDGYEDGLIRPLSDDYSQAQKPAQEQDNQRSRDDGQER